MTRKGGRERQDLARDSSNDAHIGPSVVQSAQQLLPAPPGFGAHLLVGHVCIGSFAAADETVSGASVHHGFVHFAKFLQLFLDAGQSTRDAMVIATVEAVYRHFDPLHDLRRGGTPIKDERGRNVRVVGKIDKCLATTPTKPATATFPSVTSRKRAHATVASRSSRTC